jgi:signal recognition particle GTPase
VSYNCESDPGLGDGKRLNTNLYHAGSAMRNTSKRKARSGRSASKAPNETQEKGKALERIVKLLEAVLSDRDVEIKVRHSLIDRSTGEPREVDIHIEEKLRGQIHASVVECRCHKKRWTLPILSKSWRKELT